MRLILVGQRAFGAAVLQLLRERGDDVAQVFAPRGDALHDRAERAGIEWRERVTAEAIANECDLIVCAHAHAFVSRQARDRTELGAIGYHPSLLPRHRGRDAVRWTIHMRDEVAGGSVYWLGETVDGGPVAARDWCHVVPGWTASDLWKDALFPMGLRLVGNVLDDIERGQLVRVPQDERCATWEPSWERPPVHRPDLPRLAAPGATSRYRVVRERTGGGQE